VATKKLYFKIGEACKKLDIQPYVLRYWETEFPALSPDKSKSGQRVYTAEDLDVIQRIKELLYEEGFTIAGAKKKLAAELKSGLKPGRRSKDEPPTSDEEEAGVGEEGVEVVEAPASTGDSDVAAELDAMRKGVEKAVEEARGILDFLDSKAKSR
jgi:DNA-binding transcriptional MerR regulator